MNEQQTDDKLLRAGKWTAEEEEYAHKLIELFNSGYDDEDAFDGQTLRCFLATKLQCSIMRVTKKFAKYDGLGTRFKFSTDRMTVESNCTEQLKLPVLERSYRLKDETVQSNRLRRKKYYIKYENVESSNDPIISIGGKRVGDEISDGMILSKKNQDNGSEMSLKLSRSESMDTIFDMDEDFEFENLTSSDNLAMSFISDDALMM
mmetsp:Transcript_4091/g.4181  ORF Transcript_4091/g.4181 Transcript_4091/m.4181 type:complete len:205 (+) Transcript_4091:82-696(+)